MLRHDVQLQMFALISPSRHISEDNLLTTVIIDMICIIEIIEYNGGKSELRIITP